jgi:inosine/xanthosine triphosphate pyrophosphatase family protein
MGDKLKCQVIAATRNQAKLTELRRLVGDAADIIPLPHDISPEGQGGRWALTAIEDGSTVEENAANKALFWSRLLEDKLVIASDGGLLIPALGSDWDPTRTRRFAGEDATDLERARALLARTAHLRGNDRQISWRESVAVTKGGVLLGQWSADSEPGLLATSVDTALIEGGDGFWVESIWICPDITDRRLASLNREERAARGDHWCRLESSVRAFLITIC